MTAARSQEPDRTPEVNLWRAVVEQHLRDAVSHNVSDRRLRQEARQWFSERGPSFRYVCGLAGFDPDDLSKRALAMIEQHDRDKPRLPQPPAAEQRRGNGRRNQGRRYTHNGKTLTLAEWSHETGVGLKTLQSRLFTARWPIERALSEPSREQRMQHRMGGTRDV